MRSHGRRCSLPLAGVMPRTTTLLLTIDQARSPLDFIQVGARGSEPSYNGRRGQAHRPSDSGGHAGRGQPPRATTERGIADREMTSLRSLSRSMVFNERARSEHGIVRDLVSGRGY